MPVIVGLLAILGGAAFWYWRLQQARDAAETLAEAAQEVRLAARRFGFRRKVNVHPAESIDDPRLAALSIVTAMAQMDEAWGREMSQSLTFQTQSIFGVRRAEAEEMVVFAKWMSDRNASPL